MKTQRVERGAWLGLVSVLLAACGGAKDPTPPTTTAEETSMVCTPGAVKDCGCVEGQATCNEAGTVWECSCVYPTAKDLTMVFDDSQVYIDASRAYVSRGSTIHIVSWTGESESFVGGLPDTARDIQAVTGNAGSIYFSYAANGDANFAAKKDALDASLLSLGDNVPDSGAELMAASSDTLFVAYLDVDHSAENIYSCPAAGDCELIADKQPQPSGLSFFGHSLFWTNYVSGDQFSAIALDLTDPTSGPVTLAEYGSIVQVAGDGVYFSHCSDSSKTQCELDRITSATGSAELILDHVPAFITHIGDESYFVEDGAIMRQGPDDTSPKRFFYGNTVRALLTNGTDLFAIMDVGDHPFPELYWLGKVR